MFGALPFGKEAVNLIFPQTRSVLKKASFFFSHFHTERKGGWLGDVKKRELYPSNGLASWYQELVLVPSFPPIFFRLDFVFTST